MSGRAVLDPRLKLIVLGVVLIGSVAYLLARALGGFALVRVTATPRGYLIATHNPRPWLILALVAGVLSVLNWVVAERRALLLSGTLRRERERLAGERADAEHAAAGWRSRREWGDELDRRLLERRRTGGSGDGVPGIVLELTMALVEAEQGLLLRRPGGADAALVPAAARGLGGDPAQSGPGQRFAAGVPAGAIVREDGLLAIPVTALGEVVGVIVCAGRAGGFAGLDEAVLLSAGAHAGAVLETAG